MADEKEQLDEIEPQENAAESPEMLKRELAESAKARAGLYRLISLLFSGKPEGPLVEGLAQTINPDAAIENPLMAAGFKEIAEYLSPQRTNATLLDLVVDYSLSIEKAEFTADERLGAPRDQLGATCESLYMLCGKQAESLEGDDLEGALKMLNIQNDLYTERLSGLVGQFCDAVDRDAVTLFYRGASKLARGFMQEERLFIDDSIAAVVELQEAAGEKPADE